MLEQAAEIVRPQTLVEQACGGRECKVLGSLPPGGRRIYLDERLEPGGTGLSSPSSCTNSHAVHREYLVRYGVHQPSA